MKAQDNPFRVEPWTITQLHAELQNDLKLCTTDNERSCCTAQYTRQMREMRAAMTRKLTPGEESVLAALGV